MPASPHAGYHTRILAAALRVLQENLHACMHVQSRARTDHINPVEWSSDKVDRSTPAPTFERPPGFHYARDVDRVLIPTSTPADSPTRRRSAGHRLRARSG